MEELYINDKKVDLGDARITLNHKSNLLGDITTINASNSLTIKLPKTVRNREILDCPDQPSYSGKYLRKYINARYFRNGIEILKGFAVLLSSSDTYEICLSWGELFELTEFLNEGDTLNEYLDNGEEIMWGQGILDNRTYGAFYRNENNLLQDTPIHPSVFVSEILQKIQDKSALVFKFPQDTTDWLADKKVLCATRQASRTAEHSIKGNIITQGLGASYSEYPTAGRLIYIGWDGANKNYSFNLDDENDTIVPNVEIYTVAVLPHLTVKTNGNEPARFNLWLVAYDDKLENGGKRIEGVKFSYTSDNTYNLEDYLVIPEANDYKTYCFYIICDYDYTGYISSISGTMEILSAIEDTGGGFGEIPYPGYFPPYINLPDISLADFIKNISALTGTFPHRYKNDPTNVITFSPLEIIYQNKSKGIDWSDKLVFRGYPKEVSYKVNDMARKNYIQYKDDEQVPTRASGVIEVNDTTLSREKNLFEMSFSASETYNNVAVIHKYSKTNDELEEFNIEPRILSSHQDKYGYIYLSFDGMSFYNIVKTRYQGYQRIMREPIVLKEDFRLTELDIKNIDFTIPIFLRQYGRYYAVMSIQDTNGICNVELLQLN